MKKCECGAEFKPTSNRQKFCEECKAKRANGANKKTSRKKAARGSMSRSAKPKTAKPRKGDPAPAPLTLDLSAHPDVYEALVQAANKEFRSPEMQAVKIISEALIG